jgi:hypothetical protein
MPPFIQHRNRTVRVALTPLIENALEETFLSADAAAASGTLTVKNIGGLGVNQFLWINPFSETSEIVTTHASSAPSGSTVTLAANTTYAHSAGEPVYRIEFNQVEISTASTLGGSKSVLTTATLDADQKELIYLDTATTSGYYYARFKNSVASAYGSYCDACPYNGFAANTVGYMIDRSLKDLGLELSNVVTILDCFEWINTCLRTVQGKLKHWPEHYAYNQVLGQTSRGTNVVAMPTDIYDNETNKSILAVRIGRGAKLAYLDPQLFDRQMNKARYTQVTTQASAGATSLAIDNSYDFDESGSVNVYVAGVKYTITYTGITRSTTAGFLTGIPASGTGAITITVPVDTYVWQNDAEGIPTYFTVRNGSIEYWPLADGNNDNQNIYSDYSKVATSVDTEGDTIDLQRFDIVQYYLTWRMWCKARKDGELVQGTVINRRFQATGFYALYQDALTDAIKTLPQNNTFPSRPNVNRISRRKALPSRPSIQDLSIDEQ